MPHFGKHFFAMRVVSLLAMLSFLFASLLPLTLSADELKAPQQVIQGISDQLQQVMIHDRDRIDNEPGYVFQVADKILLPHVDFSRVSSLVLGKHWRRAKPEQKSAFSAEFKQLLVRTYSTAFREFKTWEIKHIPLRIKEGAKSIAVRTQVLRTEAPPIEVIYRMHNSSGKWKVYDVKIEGISLVTNYRSSFSKEIRRGGMDGLIARIAKLNKQRIQKVAASG